MSASPDLSELQAEALASRQTLLAELGLSEIQQQTEQLATRAKDARKRGAAAAKKADVLPTRTIPTRSSARVQGLTPEGGVAEKHTQWVGSDYTETAKPTGPEGDVAALDFVSRGYDKNVAAAMLDRIRSGIGLTACATTVPEAAGPAASPRTPAPEPEVEVSTPAPARSSRAAKLKAVAALSSTPTPSKTPAASSSSTASAMEDVHVDAGSGGASAGMSKAWAGAGTIRPTDVEQASSASFTPSRTGKDLSKLDVRKEKYVLKVLPNQSNRVYSIGFHPVSDRAVAIIGGRFGELSFWCPDVDSLPQQAENKSAAGAGAGSSYGKGSGSAAKRARRSGNDDGDDEVVEDDDDGDGAGAGAGSSSSSSAAVDIDDDEAEDDGLQGLAVFAMHTACINAFAVPRAAQHHVITTSYDGTIRCLDVTSRTSYLLHEDYDDVPSSIALETTSAGGAGGGDGSDEAGHTMWIGSRSGTVYHLDTRLRNAKTSIFDAHVKKITAVSLQSGGFNLLTSASDSYVRIFDARKLPRHTATGGHSSHKPPKPLVELEHGQGVTGAAFSPTGRYIASVSNDNKIRVFECEGLSTSSSSAASSSLSSSAALLDCGSRSEWGIPPSSGRVMHSVYHNNHTGRWLTPFKIGWDPKSDHTVLCGNMDRAVDIFEVKPSSTSSSSSSSSSRGSLDLVASLSSELLTAVPTQVAAHPTLNVIAGGTASGRAYIFS